MPQAKNPKKYTLPKSTSDGDVFYINTQRHDGRKKAYKRLKAGLKSRATLYFYSEITP